jgi:hypothetical protein
MMIRRATVARTARFLLHLLVAGAMLAPAGRLAAHEIPASVVVHAFVRAEGEELRLLVRVPLEAMRDVTFPLRGIGFLDLDALERLDPALREAARLWIAEHVTFFENGVVLAAPGIAAIRVSAPSELAFGTYEGALAHVRAPPLDPGTELYWRQALLEVLLEYPIASPASEFAILPEWAHLGQRTTTLLRFLPESGAERVIHFAGDPGLIHLDPRWYQAAASFVRLGFRHILGGADHLLFVLCLVIPFRRFLPLLALVTSFTIAHSITLAASALGFAPEALWFPPLIETLIALSIVFMAIENVVGSSLQRRWLTAFGFGLVHGFGFSFLLRESLQFAGTNVLVSLLAFNVGVELGQILVLLLAVPVLGLLFRYVLDERIGIVVLSVLVGHSAWHWMAEQWAEFREHPLEWPVLDLAFLAGATRALMILLILGAIVWLLSGLFSRWTRPGSDGPGRGLEEVAPDGARGGRHPIAAER